VKQACVVTRIDNGSKRLVAYFVPANSMVTPEQLRDFIASQLPQHMIPAFFVALPFLPLSQHGKVDRTALAELDVASKSEPVAKSVPESELERTIVQLWQRILKLTEVGLDQNFFDLGGDSLLLVAVHSNLQKALQMRIPVTDLFEFPTIRKLAQRLSRTESTSVIAPDVQEIGQRQRDAFTRFRSRRSGGGL
jgi:acyl carrier protein